MKKIKLNGKLDINKKTVSLLNGIQLYSMIGGKKKKIRKGIVHTSSIPCMIDDDSRPVVCSPTLPTTIR